MSDRRGELKEIEEIKSIPRSTLYEMIREAKNPRDGRLMASFFLLANRCSEGLAVGPDDVHKEVSVEVLDMEIEEMAARLQRLRTEVDVGRSLGRDVSGAQGELGKLFDEYQEMNELKKMFHTPGRALEVVDEIAKKYPQTLVYVVKLFTLKRTQRVGPYYTEEEAERLRVEKGWTVRKIRSRDKSKGDRWRRVVPHLVPRAIPIPTIDPLAPLFVDAVHRMEDRLFPLSRQRTWYILRRARIYDFYKTTGEMVPKNPLRHARLSEVSNYFNPLQINRFAGWKIKGTGDHYLHLRWSDYVPALVKAARAAPPLKI